MSVSKIATKPSPASTPVKYEAEDLARHHDMANAIRFLAIDAVQKANSGHPGMPMGMADVATVLFSHFLKFDPCDPEWPDRDRFILSAGHGSMLQYALLYLLGYEKMTLDDIKKFRQLGSHTAGHPEIDQAVGIETTTGPLGQGIATSVGFALAEQILQARFGADIVNHKTYVIASDGDMMEGLSHEACSLAGHLGLGNLVVLYDDNGISIDGRTDLSFSDDTLKRFEAYGWTTDSIDGHNPQEIADALSRAQNIADRPVMIACRTKIGFGSPNKEDSSSAHGSPLGDEEIKLTRAKLGWSHAPFEVPEKILQDWRKVGERNHKTRKEWVSRFEAQSESVRQGFQEIYAGVLPQSFKQAIDDLKKSASAEKPKLATRQASGKVLEKIVPLLPQLMGGSADLTPSNNTMVDKSFILKGDFSGRYIHYGVREHGMAAIMNGLALHGGIIPYAGTFLSFADYARPAMRLAALMRQRVIHVMTHDSIGLGEDGPTHQPVEHVAALRAIPNLYLFRPADLAETAEVWELALGLDAAPSVLALTRQSLPTVRETYEQDNLSRRGAYILQEAGKPHKVTIFASGSEVHLAIAARKIIEDKGMGVRVVSVPCMDLALEQGAGTIEKLGGGAEILVAVEAGIAQGWHRFIGSDGLFIGVETFGASAPYEQLYDHFGLTPEKIAERILNKSK